MSAENHIQEIDEKVHDYLNGHPFGKTRDEIIRKFNAEYSQKEILNCIERLETNDWVIDRGKLVWQPRK